MAELLYQDEMIYLKERGFKRVQYWNKFRCYLLLDAGGSKPNQSFTGYVYPHVHPKVNSIEDCVSKIEKMVSMGLHKYEFAVPMGERIPIIVNDKAWDPVVWMLMGKYNQ